MVLRLGQALLSRQPIPLRRPRQILLNSVPLLVKRRQATLCIGVALPRRKLVPALRLRVILLYPRALLSHLSYLKLSLGQAFVGSHPKPVESFFQVPPCAEPF